MMTVLSLMTDDEVRRLGARDDASFGVLDTARGALPLVAMNLDARVTGLLAALELEQTFVNSTGVPIEATYIFPLPDRAAVTRFRMEVAGRVVEGVVEERGAAREHYDRAIATGHRAAITEEDRAGVFTLRVGNLMPRESATIKLTLTGPLPIEDGEVTLRFPLVVAPRYIPGAALGGPQAGTGWAADTDAVPDASRITPPVLLPGCPNPVRLSIRATVDGGGVPIGPVASSLHAVSEQLRAGCTVVELRAPGERLDRDFILRWRLGDELVRSSIAVADDSDGSGGTFVVTVVPPALGAARRPRDIVFVLDRSGSMGGWKMVAARRAVARMVDTLGPHDRFTVFAFDNTVDTPSFPGHGAALVVGSDRNRFRAIEFLAGIEARGGTEMADPLRRAVNLLAGGYDDRDRILVLATDGQVGNEDQILRELAHHLRNVRVFTLGIDRAVNAAFLRRMAAAGGGACELVESEDRLDHVMDKIHRRIATPVVTELGIAGDGLAIEPGSLTPSRLPDLFAGAPVVIAGRYRGRAPSRASVFVTGRTLDASGLREPVVARENVTGAEATALASVWARGRIRDLEDRYATGGGGSDLEREIVSISKRYSVLSRFTAFLAVDRREIVNPGGGLRTVTQPVEMPDGWGADDECEEPMGGMSRADEGRAMKKEKSMSATRSAPPSPGYAAPRGGFAGAAPPRPTEAAPMDAMSASPSPPPKAPRPAAAPPAPAAIAPMPVARRREQSEERERAIAIPIDDAPYRLRLGQLADAIDAALAGTTAERIASDLALVVFRLTEWIEDANTVGLVDLIREVKPTHDDLTRALRDASVRHALAAAAAIRLRDLARAAPTPAPAPPSGGGRAFWK
jgi:Ca-activated chloride channel family protein